MTRDTSPNPHTSSSGFEHNSQIEKSQVDFQTVATGPDHCGICRHYLPAEQGCQIVRGHDIRSESWCNRYELANESVPVQVPGPNGESRPTSVHSTFKQLFEYFYTQHSHHVDKSQINTQPSDPTDTTRGYPFPSDLTTMSFVKNLGGSTGARLLRSNPQHRLYVAKQGHSPANITNEMLANSAYHVLGVPTAEFKQYNTKAGHPVQLARFIKGDTLQQILQTPQGRAALHSLHHYTLTHALLANWDAHGLTNDNVEFEHGDPLHPIYIDVGGALEFNSRGHRKPLTNTVPEFDSLRDPHIHSDSGAAAIPLTQSDIDNQLHDLHNRIPALKQILPEHMHDIMTSRLNDLHRRALRTTFAMPSRIAAFAAATSTMAVHPFEKVPIGKPPASNGKKLAEYVHTYLASNYPVSSVTWVPKATWVLTKVPIDKIKLQTTERDNKSLVVDTETKALEAYVKSGKLIDPIVLLTIKDGHYVIIDGHHRCRVWKLLHKDKIAAYVGTMPGFADPWELHHKNAAPLISLPPLVAAFVEWTAQS